MYRLAMVFVSALVAAAFGALSGLTYVEEFRTSVMYALCAAAWCLTAAIWAHNFADWSVTKELGKH